MAEWEQATIVQDPPWKAAPIVRPDPIAQEKQIKNVASMSHNVPRDFAWQIEDKDNVEHDGNEFQQGVWSKTKESFGRGQQQSLTDVAITEALYTGDTDKVKRAMAMKDKVLMNMAQDPLASGWFSDFIYANVQTAGQVWESMKAGGKGAAVVGGIGAGVGAAAGALIPTVGEEALTVAAGAKAGLKIGAKLGVAEGAAIFSYRQGMGEMYYEMIKNGSDPELAETVSGVAAIPYALVEIAQLKALTPNVKKALTKKLQGSVAKIVVEATKKYGKTYGTEVAEEIVQKVISVTARDTADVLSGNEIEIDKKFLTDRIKEVYEEGKGAAKGMALLPLPGAAIEVGIQSVTRNGVELTPAEEKPAETKPTEDLSKTFGGPAEVVQQFHEQEQLKIHGISAPIFGDVEAIGKHQEEVRDFVGETVKSLPVGAVTGDKEELVNIIADAVNAKVLTDKISDVDQIVDLIFQTTAAETKALPAPEAEAKSTEPEIVTPKQLAEGVGPKTEAATTTKKGKLQKRKDAAKKAAATRKANAERLPKQVGVTPEEYKAQIKGVKDEIAGHPQVQAVRDKLGQRIERGKYLVSKGEWADMMDREDLNLAKNFTQDKSTGAIGWDQHAVELGREDMTFDEFFNELSDTIHGDVDSIALREAAKGDQFLQAISLKQAMLRAGESKETINDALAIVAEQAGADASELFIDEGKNGRTSDSIRQSASEAVGQSEKEPTGQEADEMAAAQAALDDFLNGPPPGDESTPGLDENLLGSKVVTDTTSGKQTEMFDKNKFKTDQAKEDDAAKGDLPGQGTLFGGGHKNEGFLGVPFDLPEPGVARKGAEKIYQDYINRFASIENIEKKARALGMEIQPGESPTILARAYLGIGRKVESILGNKTVRNTPEGKVEITGEGLKPILDSYDKAAKPIEKNRKARENDFETYLKATRTVEDLQRKAFEGAQQDIATAEQVSKAQTALDKLQEKYGKGMKAMEAHAERLYEYQKRILHLLVDAGNLSQERYNKIVNLNQHYIPFDRVVEEDMLGGVPKQKDRFTKAKAPVGRIKGSELEVAPVMESVIKNTYKIVAAADRNKVARSVARFGRVLPQDVTPVRVKMVPIKIDPKEILTVSKEFRKAARQVTDEVRNIETDATESGKSADLSGPAKKMEKVVRDALTHRGFSEGEAKSFVSQIKKGQTPEGEDAGKATFTKETIERTIKEVQQIIISKEPVETTIFRPSQFAPKGKVIEFFVDGKRRFVELEGNLHAAMTGLDETTSNLLVKIFAVPAHWLRIGATITPEFMLRNPIRDQWTALMQSGFGFVPFVDSTGAIADILGKKDVYHEWLASGGAYAGFVELNRPALEKAVGELRHGKSILKRMNIISSAQDLSQLMEMATRLGVFKAEKRKGKTSAEAGFASREATLDFARRGAKMADYNRVMAFFNAGVQGLDKTIRTSITHPYATAIKGLTAITLPSLLLFLRNKDDEEYKEMAQWQKDLFWNFKLGDQWWRVPKPFLFGQLYGSIPERFFEYQYTKDPKAFKGLQDSIYDALTPVSGDPESGVLMTSVKPLLENAVDHSFFLQRPIVPSGTSRLEPQDQFGRYTTKAAKKMGEWRDYSPAKIENLVRGWFGGSGQYALEGIDFIANQITNEVDAERPKELADYPLVKGFVSRPPTGPSARSINEFYSDTSKIEKAYNSYQHALKEGRKDKARKLLSDKPEIRDYKALNAIRIQLSVLRKKADKVLDKTSMKKETKKKQIAKIDEKRLALAKRGNKIIEKRQ
jgi:hypothetical protein